MFGLFKKRQTIATSPEEVSVMVSAVKKAIGAQLMLAGRDEQELLQTRFCLGYLMGVLDAIAQQRQIPQAEDLLVIGAAFACLFPMHPLAFADAIALANDPEFIEGQNIGGSDLYRMVTTAKSVSLGLYDYWRRQAKLDGTPDLR